MGGPSIEAAARKSSWKWLTSDQQDRLEELRQIRKASSIANLPDDVDREDFYAAKTKDVESTCDSARTELLYFNKTMEAGLMTKDHYHEAVDDLKDIIESGECELRVLKRHKKHLVEDVDEMSPRQAKIKQSWLNLLLDKVATAGTLAKKNFNQKKFHDTMMDFYGTERISEDGSIFHYCVVTGEWIEAIGGKSQVKAAHIVPKALAGTELDNLFGVGETILQEARNSLPLHKTIEEALDDGRIVIVPNEMDGPRVASLKVVLVDEKIRKKSFSGFGKDARLWESIDGRVLRFLSTKEVAEAHATLPEKTRERLHKSGKTPEIVAENRPAQRYLYFRSVVTYLSAKRNVVQDPGVKAWVERYQKESTVMWATPGKYVRMSLLAELAFIAGDMSLPEARQTFGLDTFEEPNSSKKDECKKGEWDTDKVHALGLRRRIIEHAEEGQRKTEEESEAESSDSDDE